MGPSSVILIETRRLFREGLRQLIGGPLFKVVATASSAAEAVAIAGDARPGLVVWGPGAVEQLEDQIAAIRDWCAGSEGTRLVVLTDISDLRWLARVASCGVDAILSPEISSEVLQRSLDLVVLGQQLFPAALAHAAGASSPSPTANQQSNTPVRRSAPNTRKDVEEIAFSKRECQILHYLMTGASNKAIARELDISEVAVKAHVKALLRKVRVSNRTQVAVWAHHNHFRIADTPAEAVPGPAVAGVSHHPASA